MPIHSRLLGKLPPRHDKRDLKLRLYFSTLPTPPDSLDLTTKAAQPWGMMLNSDIGDCTCAAAGHLIQTWTGNAGNPVTPADPDILTAYEAVSGYNPADPNTDQGAVETDVLNYWRQTGVAGHKIGAYASVTPQHLPLVKTAVFLFEGLYIGLSLPATAQNQTVWDVVNGPGSDAGSWGGHAVCVVAYNATGPICITWGAPQQMTWAFWGAYVDECYAIISPDYLSGGKSCEGFDAAALQTDLAAVTK